MARIAGVNIPTNKRVLIALQYIHGIGAAKALEICTKVGIAEDRRVNQLTDAEVLAIRETIDREYVVEGDLRRDTPTPARVRVPQKPSLARSRSSAKIFSPTGVSPLVFVWNRYNGKRSTTRSS